MYVYFVFNVMFSRDEIISNGFVSALVEWVIFRYNSSIIAEFLILAD